MTERFPVVSETFVGEHVAGLRARGHDVTLVALQSTTTAAWRARPGPAALRFAVGRGGFASRGFANRLRVATEVAAGGPYDVVHAHFGPTGAVAVALRHAGVFAAPIVCTFHGYDANVTARRWPGCYDGMLETVEAVTAGSEFMRGVVIGLGFAPERVTRWPQGVDTAALSVPDRARAGDGFHLLTVARLVEFKAVDVALRAMALARRAIPELHYVVIGDGDQRASLERLLIDLDLRDAVTLRGACDHDAVFAALGAADVFVHLGRVDHEGHCEGQGVAPLEASAAGLPVVASAVGGLCEVVVDGETGILTPPEDAAAVADALVGLFASPERRRQLGAAGRAHVERAYSRDKSSETVETLYRALTS